MEFYESNPIISLIYFLFVILITVFNLHPVVIFISLIAGFLNVLICKGNKEIKSLVINILVIIPMIAIINSIFNHKGVTILLYVNNLPITLESIKYGIMQGIMFATVILWIAVFNEFITSDKILYIFTKVSKTLGLIMNMSFRFIPRFKKQLKIIIKAQKGIRRDLTSGNIFKRINNGLNILSILITWALENGVDTADSMRARGYGIRKRSSYKRYKFNSRDIFIGIIMIILMSIILNFFIVTKYEVEFFPKVIYKSIPNIVSISFLVFCLLPVINEIMEEIKWKLLR